MANDRLSVSGNSDRAASLHADDWELLVDGMLRGLGHALSNRVAGLSAVVDIFIDDGASGADPEAQALMRGELGRLDELTRVVKLLARDGDGTAEAFSVVDVVQEVTTILPMLAGTRATRWSWEPADVQPVRAERWALRRALLLVANGCQALAESQRCTGTFSLGGDDAQTIVTLTLVPQSGEPLARCWEPGRALSSLLDRLDARFTCAGDTTTLSLPTLQETRRREREARGGA